MTSTVLGPPRPTSLAARASASSGALAPLVAVAVCLLPILRPAGPGNSGVADVAIVASIGVAVLWASRAELEITIPTLFSRVIVRSPLVPKTCVPSSVPVAAVVPAFRTGAHREVPRHATHRPTIDRNHPGRTPVTLTPPRCRTPATH